MDTIFISHANDGKELAAALADELEHRGVRTWRALDSVPAGVSWVDAVSEAIRSSSAVVAVVTPESSSSRAQSTELSLAVAESKGKPLIPVVSRRGSDIPFFLAQYQALYADDVTQMRDVADRIARAVTGGSSSSAASVSGARPDYQSALRTSQEAAMRRLEEVNVRYARQLRRQLLLMLIVAISAVAAALTVWRGESDRAVLSALVSAIAGLISAVLGYYFGRTASSDSEGPSR